MIKKNVPYKVLKALMVALIIFTLVNIAGLWVSWLVETNGAFAFGITTGCFTCATLIAMAICAFLNQKIEARKRGWLYSLFAVLHTVFVIVCAVCAHREDKSAGALFTVFLAVILVIAIYLVIRENNPFRKKSALAGDDTPISRSELGANPSFDSADEAAARAANGEAKPVKDEKTGIISL